MNSQKGTEFHKEHVVAQMGEELRSKPEVGGSFPMVSSKFFIDMIPFGNTVVLWSTQPLTEMSTRYISWG